MIRLRTTLRGLWRWIRVDRGCLIGPWPGWRCWGRMLVNIESGKIVLVDVVISNLVVLQLVAMAFDFCIAVLLF